ncbi:MAG: transposase [Candidatus Firestonebacteria bacterium]|nr:transposase [Candidatus Firestonebacteria bacterium]
MARPYRLLGENCFYHITSRGNERKNIFLYDSDYKKFMEYLLKAKEKYQFHLYGYVLISNHYHLLIETLKPNLPQAIHSINSSYTTYFNLKHKKCGHVFQGRYKSLVVDKDNYFLELTRYIHLNPVRAKIVDTPDKYIWSSYNGYINKKGDGIIDKKEVANNIEMTVSSYKSFVLEAIGKKEDLFKDLYAGFILGGAKFIKDKLKDLKHQVEDGEYSYKKFLLDDIKENEIVNAVAKKYKKIPEEIYNRKRRPCLEKKIAIYLMKRLTNLPNKDIGKLFIISYSAVSKASSWVEKEMNENKRFNKEIGELLSHFKG